MRKEIKVLNEVMEKATGCTIGVENIKHDRRGLHKCIPAHSLSCGYPLILCRHDATLMVVLAYEDYKQVANGQVSAQEYVDKAYWRCGYLWKTNDIKAEGLWSPVNEPRTGIRKPAEFQRYLKFMQCYTLRRYSAEPGFVAKSRCMKCNQMRCPYSQIVAKKAGANPDKEDGYYKMRRLEFYESIITMIQERTKLKVKGTYFTYKVAVEPNKIYLAPDSSKKNITLVFSSATYRELVYGAEKGNLDQIIKDYEMVAVKRIHEPGTDKISFGDTMEVTSETTAESLLEFWRKK